MLVMLRGNDDDYDVIMIEQSIERRPSSMEC